MSQVLTGTIHGNTIVLDGAPSLPDGQSVEIEIRNNLQLASSPPISFAEDTPPGWWTAEDDQILDEIYRARKQSNRPEISE